MIKNKFVALGAAAVAVTGLIFVAFTSGTSNQDESARCRTAARSVFDAVTRQPPAITQSHGQTRIDEACSSVSATDRKAILDTERTAAIARVIGAEGGQP